MGASSFQIDYYRNSRRGKRRIIIVAACSAAAVLGAAGIYAVNRPEIFITSRIGRAAAGRLVRVGFVRSYVESRPEVLITPRTVRVLCERMGFDMDDADNFRSQLEAEREKMAWGSLSPEKKRRQFAGLINTRYIRYNIPFLMAMPEEHREEVVLAVAGTLKEYRRDMNRAEAVELKSFLDSPQGRRQLAESQAFFLNELTPEEMRAIGPVVDEIVKLSTEILK